MQTRFYLFHKDFARIILQETRMECREEGDGKQTKSYVHISVDYFITLKDVLVVLTQAALTF